MRILEATGHVVFGESGGHLMEEASLFARLGGRDGITKVVNDVMTNHMANPVISTRFAHAQQTVEAMAQHAVEFFCTGLTGVDTYAGRPLAKAHAGMNISEQEFIEVLDDILAALAKNGIGEPEQGEVLKILYGMKGDVIRL
jgi:hemoglobin